MIGRGQEREKLSCGDHSRTFHWCIKGPEKLISDNDIATSNPALRDCLKWVSSAPCCPDFQAVRWKMAPAQRLACRARPECTMDAQGLSEANCAHVINTSEMPGDNSDPEQGVLSAPRLLQDVTCCLSMKGQADELAAFGRLMRTKTSLQLCEGCLSPAQGCHAEEGHRGCRLMPQGTYSSCTHLRRVRRGRNKRPMNRRMLMKGGSRPHLLSGDHREQLLP